MIVCAIFVDLRKAVDTVPHRVLFTKLITVPVEVDLSLPTEVGCYFQSATRVWTGSFSF